VVDYIGRWLGGKFISPAYLDDVPPAVAEASVVEAAGQEAAVAPAHVAMPAVAKYPDPEPMSRPRAAIDDAPSCSECGMLMTPNGSCYKCANCGSTSGCS
jgi:ribonucleoside-diphosphate reductase alpha chain